MVAQNQNHMIQYSIKREINNVKSAETRLGLEKFEVNIRSGLLVLITISLNHKLAHS